MLESPSLSDWCKYHPFTVLVCVHFTPADDITKTVFVYSDGHCFVPRTQVKTNALYVLFCFYAGRTSE